MSKLSLLQFRSLCGYNLTKFGDILSMHWWTMVNILCLNYHTSLLSSLYISHKSILRQSSQTKLLLFKFTLEVTIVKCKFKFKQGHNWNSPFLWQPFPFQYLPQSLSIQQASKENIREEEMSKAAKLFILDYKEHIQIDYHSMMELTTTFGQAK